MKNKLIMFLILIIILSTGNVIFAEEYKGKIIVNSESVVKLKPDTANLTFSVITTNKSQSKALSENTIISNKIIKNLEDIKMNKSNIISSYVYIEPIYDYEKDPTVVVSYRATNNITLETNKLDQLSKIIDTVIKSGATSLTGINYTSKNFNTSYNKALNIAISDAIEKGESIRKTLNIKSIKPILIEETSKNYAPAKENNLDINLIKEENLTTPIFIDDLDVYASVKIEFAY